MPKEKDIFYNFGSQKKGHEIASLIEDRMNAKLDKKGGTFNIETKQNPNFKTKVAIEAIHATMEGESLTPLCNKYKLSENEVKTLRNEAYKYLVGNEARFFEASGFGKDFDKSISLRASVECYVTGNTKTASKKFDITRKAAGYAAYVLETKISEFFEGELIKELNERRNKTPRKP